MNQPLKTHVTLIGVDIYETNFIRTAKHLKGFFFFPKVVRLELEHSLSDWWKLDTFFPLRHVIGPCKPSYVPPTITSFFRFPYLPNTMWGLHVFKHLECIYVPSPASSLYLESSIIYSSRGKAVIYGVIRAGKLSWHPRRGEGRKCSGNVRLLMFLANLAFKPASYTPIGVQDWSPHMSFILKGSQISTL